MDSVFVPSLQKFVLYFVHAEVIFEGKLPRLLTSSKIKVSIYLCWVGFQFFQPTVRAETGFISCCPHSSGVGESVQLSIILLIPSI